MTPRRNWGDPVREVLDDVRAEAWQRRAQVMAFVTYVVLAAGGLYLFSSIGADSRTWFDTVRRTTLALVGVGVLALGVLLGAATLVVDRGVRRRAQPREIVHAVGSRRLLAGTMVAAVLGMGAGAIAYAQWA